MLVITGSERARGEYLTFIDSDDYIDPLHLEYLYNTLVNMMLIYQFQII